MQQLEPDVTRVGHQAVDPVREVGVLLHHGRGDATELERGALPVELEVGGEGVGEGAGGAEVLLQFHPVPVGQRGEQRGEGETAGGEVPDAVRAE